MSRQSTQLLSESQPRSKMRPGWTWSMKTVNNLHTDAHKAIQYKAITLMWWDFTLEAKEKYGVLAMFCHEIYVDSGRLFLHVAAYLFFRGFW